MHCTDLRLCIRPVVPNSLAHEFVFDWLPFLHKASVPTHLEMNTALSGLRLCTRPVEPKLVGDERGSE